MKAWICKAPIQSFTEGQIVFKGDSYTSWVKPYCAEVEVPSDIDTDYMTAVFVEYAPECWTKEGEETVFAQPMTPEYWVSQDEQTTVYEQPMTQEYWVSADGETTVYEDPQDETYVYHAPEQDATYTYYPSDVDMTWTYVPEVLEHWEVKEDTTKKLTDQMNKEISDAYNTMTSDILAEMTKVFGTTKTDSAIAYQETWKEMAVSPELYSTLALKARFDIDGVCVLGDLLDTDQKILDYATAKTNQAKQYAVYRMTRIEQFRNDKEAIVDSYGV